MAKDIDRDDDDDKFEKMDEESLGFLEQIRKGKSRNFVLSMKGNKVRSMVVKKKPIKEKDRKAARGEGFLPIFGVATGMGAKLTFTIARSDGFDEKAADRKTEKLKKFLSTQTGKVFKPEFELVDAPPPIPFDEDDLADPLIARFMKMEPVITKACDTHPDSIPVIQASVNMIRGLLQEEETRQQAGPKMDEFVQYLKDLLGGGSAVPPAPPLPPGSSATPPVAPVQDSSVLAGKLAEALKRLKPLMDKVIDADPNRKGGLHATMAQIAGEIKAKQFDQAKQNVTDFATLLKSLAAQQEAASELESVDRLPEFTARRDALEPRLLEARRAVPDEATKLGTIWDHANEQANTGNLNNALSTLDRLEQAINEVMASAPQSDAERFGIQDGIVAERRRTLEAYFRKCGDVAIAEGESEIAKIRLTVEADELDDEPDDLEAAVNEALEELHEHIHQQLVTALATESRAEVLRVVERCRQSVASHELVVHLRSAKENIGVDPKIDEKFETLFQSVVSELNKAAV